MAGKESSGEYWRRKEAEWQARQKGVNPRDYGPGTHETRRMETDASRASGSSGGSGCMLSLILMLALSIILLFA